MTTPTWRRFQAVLQYRRGQVAIFQEATTGNGWLLTGEVDVRPVPTVRAALTGTIFRLDRLDGSEFARSTIPRLKIEYQPQRELFFRAIGEYRSDRLAALEDPTTGAPLFVGGAAQPLDRVQWAAGRPAGVVRTHARGPWRSSATAARSRRTKSSTGRGFSGRPTGSS